MKYYGGYRGNRLYTDTETGLLGFLLICSSLSFFLLIGVVLYGCSFGYIEGC